MELNKIYNEDCLITMSKMQDNFVDYTLTSPPYNVGNNSLNGEGKKYEGFDDKLSDENYLDNQIQVIDEMLRVSKYHVFYNIQMLSNNKQTIFKLFGHYHDKIKEIIIWNKKYGVPAMEPGVFNSAYEYIIILSNDQPNKRKFYDTKFKGSEQNVFVIRNKHSNPFAKVHKAIMPLDVPRYLMQIFGKQNDIWYDPYMGTGTTAVASILEKKQYIGSEIYEKYVELSIKRIKPYISQTTLF
jgi:site-specific DNA-methyltransferase (adenine-specific)